MKHFYIAVTIAENGKFYAYVVKLSPSDNILPKLKINGILHANICSTKKQATETVNHWNACYKANGTFLFDEPIF